MPVGGRHAYRSVRRWCWRGNATHLWSGPPLYRPSPRSRLSAAAAMTAHMADLVGGLEHRRKKKQRHLEFSWVRMRNVLALNTEVVMFARITTESGFRTRDEQLDALFLDKKPHWLASTTEGPSVHKVTPNGTQAGRDVLALQPISDPQLSPCLSCHCPGLHLRRLSPNMCSTRVISRLRQQGLPAVTSTCARTNN